MNAVSTVEPQAAGFSAAQQTEQITGAKNAPLSSMQTKTQGAFSVDIGKGGMKPDAYAGKKASFQDIAMQNEGALSAQRDMDIVLSHTLSKEDYKKAREDGYDPSDIEADETTTIVDHIKAQLLMSGKEVAGVTDDLSSEQLEQITGSKVYAESLVRALREQDLPVTEDNVRAVTDAAERAMALPPMSDETLLYMVENEITPTIDNIYLASHSAKGRQAQSASFFAEAGGYLTQTAETADIEGLKPQIETIAKKAGLSTDETTEDEAKTLIGAGVTLTPEHLAHFHTLKEMMLPPERDTAVRAAVSALADGKRAVQGNLADPESLFEKAARIAEETEAITEEGLREAVSAADETETEDLTLKDLTDATRRVAAQPETAAAPVRNEQQETKLLRARLQLEEVRLSMSVNTNLTLLRQGFAIDTAPMQALIDQLQKAIASNGNVMFHGEVTATSETVITDGSAQYRLYTETNLKVSYLRTELPVGVIGALKDEFKTDTLDDIFSKAQTWKVAEGAYETMQTEVRRDLGDSIKKAFRNADALLEDIGVEQTEDHLRAVRILGYNRMEVTRENVEQVSAVDARLTQVLDELKPAAVLDLIRDGKNPLTMTLDELADALKERNEKREDTDDTYARFLYKLEKNGDITEAERTSYIGIYRMFETLKKTDHAAIGNLLQTGAEMSIKNLLTATRSLKTVNRGGVRMTADDGADGYKITNDTNTIDRQIETAFQYYSAKADSAFAHLAPEKLHALPNPENTLLPAFAEQMETLPEDADADAAYDAEALTHLREVLTQEDKITDDIDMARLLSSSEIPVTTANLEAMQTLRAAGSFKTKQTLWEEMKARTGASEIDAEDAEDYEAQVSDLQSSIEEQMLSNETTYVDHRALSLMHRTLSVASGMARHGSFELPVEKDGRTISMHVTLSSDTGDGAGVSVTMETASYGTLGARISVSDSAVTSILSTDFGETPQTVHYLEEVRDRFTGEITRTLPGLTAEASAQSIVYHVASPVTLPGADRERTDTHTLLQLAKAFATAV